MTGDTDNKTAEPEAGADDFGVLVGWSAENLGDRTLLKLQSVRSAHRRSADDVREFRYFLSRNQAAVLANFLFEITGQTPPVARRRCWIRRLLG
jgi:hypothetical protein